MSRPETNARTQHLVRDKLLEQRFLDLWQRCLLPGVSSDPKAIWDRVAQHYAEPHRHYHDQQHLAHCLDQIDLASGHIDDADQVEMAIWFHDIINVPQAKDNEQRSAELFRSLADSLFDPAFIAAVVDLILVTTHREQPGDADHQFICDIDLASFGCPWECFIRDSDAVKAEFPGPEEDYFRGQAAFLKALLARPRIFMTDFFNARYEQQARDNIQLLLRDLKKQSAGIRPTPTA
ncbi:MAG: hypothetical protein WBN68_21635 [Sedimenticolaceae bacterium]